MREMKEWMKHAIKRNHEARLDGHTAHYSARFMNHTLKDLSKENSKTEALEWIIRITATPTALLAAALSVELSYVLLT